MAEVTPDPIMEIAMGFMAAKHLFVASEIGLFTGLAQGPATLDELAATCGIPRRTAGISADAMVSVGLLERDGERYCNSEAAAAFLAGQPGPDLRPMLRFWNRISYPGWLGLEDAVRAGAGQAKFGQFSTEEQQIFSAGVEAFSAATAAALGRVDGFCPDKGASEGDESGKVLRGFLAAQRDPLEALELANTLLDAGAAFIKRAWEELRLGGGIAAVRDDGTDAAPACRFAVCLAVIALVADHRPGRDVRADIEQDLEITAVAGLAAGQVEGQRQTTEIALQVNFG
jgi:hypothetical protein